jgi:phospholipid/cholesterol/gamma-HCH transport system ATP-binding protein
MIKVNHVYKSFGDNHVLNDITAQFQKGITNLVIGQSGSGKSVFLKCLIGLFEPDSGEVYYDDYQYGKLSPKQKRELRKQMGMVFQGGALFDSMTVQENTMFPLRMLNPMSQQEMLKRVDEVLERVNLEGVNQKMPADLSGGMKKRVSIARGIVNYPKYLFCDEPNSGLDPRTSSVIDELIQEITKENNITTIINTHDMNSVFEIGENIIFLKDGILEWKGDRKNIHKCENDNLNNFVYSSNLFKQARKANLKGL